MSRKPANNEPGLAARFGLIAIRAYQLTLSPLRPNTCRFEPSCSAYGMEAIREHGLVKGSGLTLWRILRCNPWNAGGHDPVPPRDRARRSQRRDAPRADKPIQ